MKLVKLLDLAGEMTAYRRIAEGLEQEDGVNRALLPDVARPYVIAALHKKLELPLMLLTARPETAKKLQEQISSWSDFEVRLLPEPAVLPYQRIASDDSVAQQRLKLLSLLANYNTAARPPLLIASAAALMQKTIRLSDFNSSRHIVKQGMNAEPLGLVKRWQDIGYKLENIIEVSGTISRRGGILDIYPLDSELPVRLEFFGNTIENLRFFDPVSQRSLQKTGQIEIGAAAELPALEVVKEKLKRLDYSNCSHETKQQFKQDIEALLEGGVVENRQFYTSLFNEGSILDYLPQHSLLLLDEPQRIKEEADSLSREAVALLEEKVELIDFSDPYYILEYMLVTISEAEPKLREDLKNKKIGMLTNKPEDFSTQYLKDFTIETYSDIILMIEGLKNKDIEGILLSVPLGKNIIEENNGLFSIIEIVESEREYNIVFQVGSPLRDEVNNILKEMQEDGTYQEIHDKWFALIK